jgi:hypothetical protein
MAGCTRACFWAAAVAALKATRELQRSKQKPATARCRRTDPVLAAIKDSGSRVDGRLDSVLTVLKAVVDKSTEQEAVIADLIKRLTALTGCTGAPNRGGAPRLCHDRKVGIAPSL